MEQEQNNLNQNQNSAQDINEMSNNQQMSSFENNNLNSGQSNKNNLGLIIGVTTVLIAGICIIFALLKFGNESNDSDKNETGKIDTHITENDINEYDIEKKTTWINEPLGIIYDMPNTNFIDILNGAKAFAYIHGSSFKYYSEGFDKDHYIFVEKSKENNNNLETLASDIIGEKLSSKYKSVYKFGFESIKKFVNEKIEKVRINNIETIYFESENILIDDDWKYKIIGYNFEYNNQKISVYGTLPLNGGVDKDLLKKYLQYMINSIKKYEGQSLQALNGDLTGLYDAEMSNRYRQEANTKFSLRAISSHVLNGVLTQGVSWPIEINPNYLNWDGTLDNIFEATKNQKIGESGYPYYYSDNFSWVSYEKINNTWTNVITSEILKEDYITINDIEMKHYVLKTRKGENGGRIISIYTFILDNIPYIYAYGLDGDLFDGFDYSDKSAPGKYIVDMSEEELNVIIEQTEIVSKSAMLSIKILNN